MTKLIGLGYRREMADWDMSAIQADFFEVAPENWLHRDCSPLHALLDSGRPIQLHGVALNIGGHAAIQSEFLRDLRKLIKDLNCAHYSDHLAASGDGYQLYDLFPIPFTLPEAYRVSDRIRQVQDILGQRIAVENSTWYTNIGELPEPDFIATVVERADCHLLLDLNNILVNYKNHGGYDIPAFIQRLDLKRVSYMHVAGHEFDARFSMYIDTHSQPVEHMVSQQARQLQDQHDLDILLEWDNDVPDMATINQELTCLRSTTT